MSYLLAVVLLGLPLNPHCLHCDLAIKTEACSWELIPFILPRIQSREGLDMEERARTNVEVVADDWG